MVCLIGSVGQLLGVFVVLGLKIEVLGDVNDYVGKGLLGGMIIVCLFMVLFLMVVDNMIIGNIVFYGVIDGYLFVVGCVGECFVVRNLGVIVVIEGCGSNGCEYMIGGVVVIFGWIGVNFGVGMIGGMVYLYDLEGLVCDYINVEMLVMCLVMQVYWEDQLYLLIVWYQQEIGLQCVVEILQYWNDEWVNFLQICFKEMLLYLKYFIVDVDDLVVVFVE